MENVSTWEFLRSGVGTSLSLNLRVRESKLIATDNAGPIRHVVQLCLSSVRIAAIHITCSGEVSSECAKSSDEGASCDVHISNHVQREAMLHDDQRKEQKVGCELHEIYDP